MTRWIALLALAACGSNHPKTPDAAIDAPPDAPPPVMVAGEYIDWDSAATAFCGIFMAKYQVQGDTAMATTPPNGRIRVTVPPGQGTALVRLNLTPPTDPTQCATASGTYTVPGIVAIQYAVIATGQTFSARAFTDTRRTSFFQQVGLTYDAAKAQVVVHVDGTMRAVSIMATHDTAIAFDGTQWAAGTTGMDVYFPNVDVGSGMVGVTMGSPDVGEGQYPVEAGKVTYVTLVGM